MSKKKNNLNYIPASAKTAAQKKEEAKQNSRENLSAEARAKLLKKRAWTLSAISLCFVLVLTLSILFASYTPTYYNEKTNKEPESNIVSGVIENDEFGLSDILFNVNPSNVLQQPYYPAGWTLTQKTVAQSVLGTVSRDSGKKDKVEKDLKANGVADADLNSVLSVESGESATADKNVLLIYNKTETDARAYSSSFSVPANSYLKITVRARTNIANGGAFISFKTSASDSKAAERSFTGINHSEWKDYTFYVEGNKTSSKTLYLFVGLGTSSDPVQGWAEFDYAKAEQIKKADYIAKTEGTINETVEKTKSYVENKNDQDLFDSMLGSSVMTYGEKLIGEVAGEYELPFYNHASLPVYKLANTTTDGVNSTFMKLTNKLEVAQSVASPYYRLSFWAKTKDLKKETGAYFYVRLTTDGDKTVEYKSIDLVSTSTANDDLNSGWEEFVLLFKPDNNTSYNAEIVFSLGALVYSEQEGYKPAISNVDSTGSLYVTEFELKEIFPSEYNNASAGKNLAKVSLTNSASTGLVTNGSFDAPVSNASGSGAHDPNGWTVEFPRVNGTNGYEYVPHASSDLQFGVASKNSAPASVRDAWFAHTGSDNILMISAQADTAVGFISNSFTIPANSQYVISVLVKVANGGVANVYLTGDVEQSFTAGSVANDKYFAWNDFATGGYTKYNFVIKTGDKAKQVSLELWAGSKDATKENNAWTGLTPAGSMIAFDQASADSITADQFKAIVESENVFTKTEKEGFVKDDEGNDTTEKQVVDVEYATEKENVWVRDFSYADETGAIDIEDEIETDKDDAVVEPINWLLFSSLIMSFAVIIFLWVMISKKFKKA